MSRVIMGIQPVREAIRVHGNRIESIQVSDSSKSNRPLIGLMRMAESQRIPIKQVERRFLDSITHNASHQGVLAHAPELRIHSLHEVIGKKPTLLTLLDRISDPQNFGAIIRSSVAFRSEGIIWPEHDSAPLSPATFRASAGAVEHACLCRVRSLLTSLQALQSEGLIVLGLDGAGPTTLDELDLSAPIAIVVGAEGFGLRKSIRTACNHIVRLPTSPPLDTLNASVSAAIALYEVQRQRRHIKQ